MYKNSVTNWLKLNLRWKRWKSLINSLSRNLRKKMLKEKGKVLKIQFYVTNSLNYDATLISWIL